MSVYFNEFLKLRLIILGIFLFSSVALHALNVIEVSNKSGVVSILEEGELYLGEGNLTKKQIEEGSYLKEYNQKNVNIPPSGQTVWIHFRLKNSSNESIEKALVLNSPSLEFISLFTEGSSKPRLNGISHQSNQSTIYYSYIIHIPPNSIKEYYLRVASPHKSFFFNLTLQSYEEFRRNDAFNQAPRLVMLGILLGLMIYAFLLGFYSQDISYFYYGMYLFFTLTHQVTFLGLTQIYFPHWLILFDMPLAITKLALGLFFAILFAISFLKIDKKTIFFKIYMLFLFASLWVVFFVEKLWVMLLLGVAFVFFNAVVATLRYRAGYKQARLFIVGFGVVSVAYILVVLDSFGFTSTLDYFPNILMWAFTIEVLALTLAFADRYKILQEIKEKTDRDREKIIKNEVIQKTADLNKALKVKSLLLKEVHHRVKNNLQIILSIIRLQNDKLKDSETKEKFSELENRINAIAKTYNMLIIEEDLDDIDMEEYIEMLLSDIEESMFDITSNIELDIDVDASLPLGKAVYIGIVINELVTNSYKYAFENQRGTIFISLHHLNNKYELRVWDTGKGFTYNKKKHTSLGLKLIHALVKEQLRGTIEMQTQNSSLYIIKFK